MQLSLPMNIQTRPAECNSVRGDDEALQRQCVQNAYVRIRGACRHAGLRPADVEDVAQEIFLWLVRESKLESAACKPWLFRVTRNFILRSRRRSCRARELEDKASGGSTTLPEDWNPDVALSMKEIEVLLSRQESLVVEAMRSGATWPEAASRAGVRPGTRDWFRKRLARRVRDLLEGVPKAS